MGEPPRPPHVSVAKGVYGPTVMQLAFSKDGLQLASAGDVFLRIWDWRSGTVLQTLRGATKGVNTAVYSPDGLSVASSSDDGFIRVWDTTTFEASQKLGVQDG